MVRTMSADYVAKRAARRRQAAARAEEDAEKTAIKCVKKWLKRGALPQQRTLNADDAKCWLEKQLRSYFTDDDALDAECALVDVFDMLQDAHKAFLAAQEFVYKRVAGGFTKDLELASFQRSSEPYYSSGKREKLYADAMKELRTYAKCSADFLQVLEHLDKLFVSTQAASKPRKRAASATDSDTETETKSDTGSEPRKRARRA